MLSRKLSIALVWAGVVLVSPPPSSLACGSQGRVIKDKYKTIEALQEGLRKKGLESSDLIIGIDFTSSNYTSGGNTTSKDLGPQFKNLHFLSNEMDPQTQKRKYNPYQEAIDIIANTLSRFDQDQRIPVYGFGDSRTKDNRIFSLNRNQVTDPYTIIGQTNNAYVHGLDSVMNVYESISSKLAQVDAVGNFIRSSVPNEIFPSGPTSFKPIVERAIEHVRQSGFSYHILLILTDGQVANVKANASVFAEAANYPLSIIIVGLGDGPFTNMKDLDNNKITGENGEKKKLDNVQFVNFHKIYKKTRGNENLWRTQFATAALQELPSQYKYFSKRHLLGEANPRYRSEYLEIYSNSRWSPADSENQFTNYQPQYSTKVGDYLVTPSAPPPPAYSAY